MLNVKRLRSEPFLWIHLSGIVLFPIFLAVSAIGLGIGSGNGYPILELTLLVVTCIIPIWLMQLTRPFDIFSVLFLSVEPESLSDEQRAILSLFKTFSQKLISTIAAVAMMGILWLIYRLSPLTIGLVGFVPQNHILGLAIAALAFCASNLFLQVPLSVVLVLNTKQAKLTKLKSYASEQIEQDFTVPGIKVNKILWLIESETSSIETTSS